MKEHGFRFIGPTVAYSLMQAVGMVNDHEVTCFDMGNGWKECQCQERKFRHRLSEKRRVRWRVSGRVPPLIPKVQ